MSALEDVYFGNISPTDRGIKKGSEYERLSEELINQEDLLFQTISKEEKELYEAIFATRYSQEEIAEKETFIHGFRLGAQIMLEILTEPNRQLVPF